MNRSSNIGRLSSLLLLQIILFMIVYLAFIALGAGLICLLGYSLVYMWELAKMGLVAGLFYLAPIYIFVGSFLFVVALYLIKPIFALFRKQPDKGVKLSLEDSPRLYDLIMETAKEVGVYIRVVEIGADNNIDECLAELDNIPELKERYNDE